MTAHALMFVDKPTFYRFVAEAESGYRYEYVRGWIMQQQAGGTFNHARLGARFAAVLERQLDPQIWAVTGADRGIDTGDTVRYADTVVEKLGAPADSLATEAPWLIVEVLSPSSEERDLATKPVEYLGLQSLQAYIVARHDEPLCYVWLRNANGAFAPAPLVVKGRDQSMQISALSATIDLAEVYRGIGE